MSGARLGRYLARIGFAGPPRPDLATLRALHAAHLDAIPFENLDVQLGRTQGTDPEAAFDKLVGAGRGGWCYEMNGLFGWALGEIGFEAMRVAGAVMRPVRGEASRGNHLCLLVRLEGAWLADVGFGGALARPLPLAAVSEVQAPFRVGLARADAGFWRFSERAGGEPFGFDFHPEPADEALLAARSAWQGSDPASGFVQNLVAQKREGARHVSLRGRVLSELWPGGESRLVVDRDAFAGLLAQRFGLALAPAEIATLWDRACARHAELFREG